MKSKKNKNKKSRFNKPDFKNDSEHVIFEKYKKAYPEMDDEKLK
jgi:hypothetical protein